MGLVHVDAHTDTSDMALGEKIYHGTPFRRCVDEGLLDCSRVVQIGIRGSSYAPDPYKYCWDQVTSGSCSDLKLIWEMQLGLLSINPQWDLGCWLWDDER